MAVLPRCLLLVIEYDLELKTHWIPTNKNTLADVLSCLDYQKITNLAPQLLYPSCNLQTHRLLIFSNQASQQLQPIISGGDLHSPLGATTTPQGHASCSSVFSPTTNIKGVHAFLLKQHDLLGRFAS